MLLRAQGTTSVVSAFTDAFRRNPRDTAIAALAIPALGTLALDPLVSIVDTAWVGRLGTVPLAALAVASAVFAAVFSIFNFVHSAITPLVAGEVGRGDLHRAGSISVGAVVIAGVVGVVVAALSIAASSWIVDAFGAEPDVAREATAYLRIRFLGLPAMLIAMVGHGVYRGHSDTRTPLFVVIGLTVINLILDPILIYGADLGVSGAAWATVVAQAFAAFAFLVLMFGLQRVRLGISRHIGRLDSLGIGRILSAGWPMMVRSAALLAALTAITAAATRTGTTQVAAHQIALQVWLFLSFVLDSYAIAAQAMVGTDLGSGDVRAARSVSNRLLALGVMTGLGLSMLLFLSAAGVPVLFGANDQVTDALSGIYAFVIVLQPLTALVYVWDGIGIGASAFRFLAASMVVAFVLTVATLVLVGDTLVGVWAAVGVLTVSRLVALAWWYAVGPLARGRGPSRVSQGA
jgi:MATE family multidrug resistance protein